MVALKQIFKSFDKKQILKGLDLKIEDHESFVLFGPSGTGKTLLMKIILGLIRPDSGEITLDGERVDRMSEKQLNEMRLRTGTLFQYNALFDSITVAENVGFYLKNHLKSDQKEVLDLVQQELARVNLAGSEVLKPVELSGGMQKRVGIARAIIHRPKMTFYDSPTDGLDPVTADKIIELIKDINSKLGTTSLVISNDMNTTFRLASHMGMLYGGRIHAYGTPVEIAESRDPYVYQFIRGLETGPLLDDIEHAARNH
jgi:phospholipid/cholesterol/gamma-HCH transport system ATP-binding protein